MEEIKEAVKEIVNSNFSNDNKVINLKLLKRKIRYICVFSTISEENYIDEQINNLK